MKWIKFKTKKPKIGQDILLYDLESDEIYLETFWKHSCGEYVFGFDPMLPTFRYDEDRFQYWMPLPDGPNNA